MASRWEANILGGKNPFVVEVTSNTDAALGVEVPTPIWAKVDIENTSKAEINKYFMILFFLKLKLNKPNEWETIITPFHLRVVSFAFFNTSIKVSPYKLKVNKKAAKCSLFICLKNDYLFAYQSIVCKPTIAIL